MKANIEQQDKNTKVLLEKWAPIINADDFGNVPIKENEKTTLAAMMETQHDYAIKQLNEKSTTTQIAPFYKILVPVLRRSYPLTTVFDLVGVQPLSGPTGYAYALRFQYGEGSDNQSATGITNKNDTSGSATFGSGIAVLTSGTGTYSNITTTSGSSYAIFSSNASGTTSAGHVIYKEQVKMGSIRANQMNIIFNITATSTEISDIIDSNTKTWISTGVASVAKSFVVVEVVGNEVGYNIILQNYTADIDGGASQLGEKTTAGETWKWSSMKSIRISLERQAVEVRTRKTKVSYTDEVVQDLQNVHGISAQQELITMTQYEIANELNQYILHEMMRKATYVSDGWKYRTSAGSTSGSYTDGRYESERFRTLYTKIQYHANRLAVTTRRGRGNFVVCSGIPATILMSLPNFTYIGDPNTEWANGLTLIGTLDGYLKVYLDTFFRENNSQGYCMIGYKGATNFDAGIIYCPYIPIQIKMTVDNDYGNDRFFFTSRDAVIKNNFGAENYYRIFSVNAAYSSLC